MADDQELKPSDETALDDAESMGAPGDEPLDDDTLDDDALDDDALDADFDPEEEEVDGERAKEKKIRERRRTRRRRKAAVAISWVLVVCALSIGKVVVRTELRDPARLARLEEERRAKLAPGEAEFSDIEYEMMGFIGSSVPLIPPENQLAAERYREFEKATRIVSRRPDTKVLTAAEMEAERERIAAIIPRQPFILYVGAAAFMHFLMGFVCAMHLGYRPRLFGVRWNLREMDPFVQEELFLADGPAANTE